MENEGMAGTDRGKVERACSLWRGFLLTKGASPELALVFCKGALMSLHGNKGKVGA